MLRQLALVLIVAIVAIVFAPRLDSRAVLDAQTPCWCCTCEGAGCDCHTCLPGGTSCDNRGGSGCDVEGVCPESFGMTTLGDGSVLVASRMDSSGVASFADHALVGAIERVAIRAGWLVARDCRGLIVHRKVAASAVAVQRAKLREILLN